MGPSAYAKRAAALTKPGCTLPWESLPRPVQELLLNPLHLHLFHEAYSGVDRVRADLNVGGLLGAYLDRICVEHQGLRTTLEQTAAEMLRRHQPALAVDVVDMWLDNDRRAFDGAPAARLARLDPIEELVSASVLMRPAREGVGLSKTLVSFTFCHQRMCEEVLARELLRGVKRKPTGEDLAGWAAEAAAYPEFVELLGALRSIVGRAANAGDGELVASLLTLTQDAVRDALIQAAVRAIGVAWGPTEAGWERVAGTLTAFQTAASGSRQTQARWMSGSRVDAWLWQRGASWGALAVARTRAGGPSDADAVESWLAVSEYRQGLGQPLEARSAMAIALRLARRLSRDTSKGVAATIRLAQTCLRQGDLSKEQFRAPAAGKAFGCG